MVVQLHHTPYTHNKNGHGPAWANSLFEDNAEYGLGLALGSNKLRERIALRMKEASESQVNAETKAAFEEWLAGMHNAVASRLASPPTSAATSTPTTISGSISPIHRGARRCRTPARREKRIASLGL